MPVVVAYDADTALYTAKTEAAQRASVLAEAKAASEKTDVQRAYVRAVEQQYRDLAKEQARLSKEAAKVQADAAKRAAREAAEAAKFAEKAEEARWRGAIQQVEQAERRQEKFNRSVYEGLDNLGDAVERLGRSFGGAANEQAQLLSGAIDLGKAGLNLAGPWGAAAGVIAAAAGGLVQHYEKIQAEAEKAVEGQKKFAEASIKGLREFERELAAAGKDAEKLTELRIEAQKKAIAVDDEALELFKELESAELELQRAIEDGTATADEATEAFEKLEAIRKASFDSVVALTAAYWEQVAARRAAEGKEIAAEVKEDTDKRLRREAAAAGDWARAEMERASAAGEYTRELEKQEKVKGKAGAKTRRERDERDAQDDADMRARVRAQDEAIEAEALAEIRAEEEASEEFRRGIRAAEQKALDAEIDKINALKDKHAELTQQIYLQAAAYAAQEEVANRVSTRLTDAAYQIGDAFQDAFTNVAGDAFGSFLDAISDSERGVKGLGKALQGSLAQALKALGKEFFVSGLGESAKALAALASLNFPGAASHGAAAGAFFTAAAAAGFAGAAAGKGVSGSGGSGGGSSGGGSRGGGASGLGRNAPATTGPQAPTIVHLNVDTRGRPLGQAELEELGQHLNRALGAHAKAGGRSPYKS